MIPGICPRCGLPASDDDKAYPRGWAPPPGVEMPESDVPPCCSTYIIYGSDEDKARRAAECYARALSRVMPPMEPPADGLCRVCRLPTGECDRSVQVGSDADKAARIMACGKRAAEAHA